jgi:hypothetical protein
MHSSSQVNYYIRGPHGAGKVYSEMFVDYFMFLLVDFIIASGKNI